VRPKPGWGQPTPRMQLVVIVRAVRGDLDNMQSGVRNDKQVPRCLALLEDVQAILRDMPEGAWDGVAVADPVRERRAGYCACAAGARMPFVPLSAAAWCMVCGSDIDPNEADPEPETGREAMTPPRPGGDPDP